MKVWQLQDILSTKDPSSNISFEMVRRGPFGSEKRTLANFLWLATKSFSRYLSDTKPEDTNNTVTDVLVMVFEETRQNEG